MKQDVLVEVLIIVCDKDTNDLVVVKFVLSWQGLSD